MFSNNEFLDSIVRLLVLIGGLVTSGVLAILVVTTLKLLGKKILQMKK